MIFEYDCPHCGEALFGSFGDNIYCSNCNKTYKTDWDYVGYDSISYWLTGVELDGKIDIQDEDIDDPCTQPTQK